MAAGSLVALFVFGLFWGLLSGSLGGLLASGFVSLVIAPLVLSSTLLAGALVWWFLPRGWKYGAVGGGAASVLAYPMSVVGWTVLLADSGDIGGAVIAGTALALLGFLLSVFITVPLGAACGALYEAILDRYREPPVSADAEKQPPSDEESPPNEEQSEDELSPLEHQWQ